MLNICLYVSILNFVVVANNGSSLFVQINSLLIGIMQSSLDESNRKLAVLERWSV